MLDLCWTYAAPMLDLCWTPLTPPPTFIAPHRPPPLSPSPSSNLHRPPTFIVLFVWGRMFMSLQKFVCNAKRMLQRVLSPNPLVHPKEECAYGTHGDYND